MYIYDTENVYMTLKFLGLYCYSLFSKLLNIFWAFIVTAIFSAWFYLHNNIFLCIFYNCIVMVILSLFIVAYMFQQNKIFLYYSLFMSSRKYYDTHSELYRWYQTLNGVKTFVLYWTLDVQIRALQLLSLIRKF